MLNTTAYLNLLTKQKEILLKMQNHKLNLKNMKSINNNSPQLKPVSINKNKTKYIKSRNQHEVDVENQVLTEKIERIIKSQRNSKYFSGSEKYSKSLNGHVMRTRQQKINEDNLRLLQRLQHSKPTYSTKKYLQEFQHIKKVQKNMSSAEFYLTDSPRFKRHYQLNTNRSFVTRRDSSVASGNSMVKDKKNYLVRDTVKLSDGKLWQVKIYFSENKKQGLKIQGEIVMDEKCRNYQSQQQQLQQKERDIKVISMSIIEANIFIARHCQNKIENMLNFLKVDQNDGSLLIVVPKNFSSNKKINNNIKEKNELPSPTKLNNPQEKKTNEIKLKKLQSLAGYEKKKIPSRQIFNTVQNKPALIDNLLESNQSVKEKAQVPKINQSKDKQEVTKKVLEQQKLIQQPSQQKESELLNENQKQDSGKSQEKIVENQQPFVEQNMQQNLNQNDNNQQANEIDNKSAQQQQQAYDDQKFDQSTSKNMKPLQKINNQQQQIIANNNKKQKTDKSQQKQTEKLEQSKQQNYGNLIKSIEQLPVDEKQVEQENQQEDMKNQQQMIQNIQKGQEIEKNFQVKKQSRFSQSQPKVQNNNEIVVEQPAVQQNN